jgi:SAM-dependent methyltransferase
MGPCFNNSDELSYFGSKSVLMRFLQTIPHDLQLLGYSQQICIDFSAIVIEQMRKRYMSDSGIDWKCEDVRDMPEPSSSVDVAFDKSTLDGMIFGSPWDPPETVRDNSKRYLNEVSGIKQMSLEILILIKIRRVLKDDGVFLYVTFRQPHFIKLLLDAEQWDILVEKLSNDEGSFEYYGYVLQKKKDA